MTQLELKLANSNSGSCRTSLHRAQYYVLYNIVFSDGTRSIEQVFFHSVLTMKSHRACTHDR